MKLSIVTINYNASGKTLNLVKSLASQTDSEFNLIVMDNGSEESDFRVLSNSIEIQSNVGKKPILIKNGKNLGFSGGNNPGIKKALEIGSDWVLLLNNDTWAEKDFMASLKPKLEQLEGIVGIPMVEGNKVAYAGKVEWLRSTLKHSHIPNPRVPIYVIGGAMAIHKDVFSEIGFLDEKYFLYFEDVDFSLRAKKAGLSLSFLEEPKVFHQVSATTRNLGRSLLLRYHYRNALYFNWKNGSWYIRFSVWLWSFWIIKKQLLKMMVMYKREESKAMLNAVFDFYRHKMGKIN